MDTETTITQFSVVSTTAWRAYRQIKYCVITCIIAAVVLWVTMWGVTKYKEIKGFSSPSSSVPVPVALAGPGRIMRISAYCPCEICCGKWADGYTASGKPAVGLIVAAPPDMPFGTVLEIPGYGRCRVQDRGGAITGNRLDILFATHQEAKQWGVQELMVKEIR